MAQHGSALQAYNNELVKCVEEIRTKRNELNLQISAEEEEKLRLQIEINALTEKLVKVNESLAKKLAARDELTKTIRDTEAAYVKILESSHALVGVLKKNLTMTKNT